MDTHRYCKSLNKLNKKQAINSIHQAYLQLKAINENNYPISYYDNEIVLNDLKKCLKQSGHIGFIN